MTAYVILVAILVLLSVLLTFDTSWMNLLQGTRNELIFANRNKAYGAYELRTDYTRRLGLAMVGALVLFAVVVGTPYALSKLGPEEEAAEKVQIVDVNLDNFIEENKPEEPPPPPEVIPPPQPQIETVQFVAVEASDDPVEEPPPTQEDLSETTASTTTQEGEKLDAPPPPPPPVEEEAFDLAAVQEQPEFPGGMAKMYQYLQNNTKYPDMEFDAGIQGKVFVEFVVEKDGDISDVKVRRGISPGLDKEAVRAVKSMPKWSPGKMNGKPVKVRFTIPVDFKLK
ncbi:MAG: energy transducer TonB [Flavobacteriales bacterium]|nr:energy transducer TonB [Flavobacteriales bacterium]MBP9079564.1 energy transducer TonB [Flavobacteriales bacterium]